VLAGILVLPSVAVAADPAKDALDKGKASLDKKDYDAAIRAFTEAIGSIRRMLRRMVIEAVPTP
jgi:hypothetical protein